jgi:hypothetical protein
LISRYVSFSVVVAASALLPPLLTADGDGDGDGEELVLELAATTTDDDLAG